MRQLALVSIQSPFLTALTPDQYADLASQVSSDFIGVERQVLQLPA